MNPPLNIWRSIKTTALLCLVMIAFVAKGNVELNTTSTANVVNPIQSQSPIDEKKGTNDSKETEKEKNGSDQITNVSFEATLSFFAVEFDNLSGFIATRTPIISTPPIHPVDTNVKLLATRYFRILFSKIQPINAP